MRRTDILTRTTDSVAFATAAMVAPVFGPARREGVPGS